MTVVRAIQGARAGAVAVLVGVALAACGSSTSTASTAPGLTTSSGGAASSSSSSTSSGTTAAAALPLACSVLTTAQVTELLGGPPAQPAGHEDDPDANFKTCRWLSTPPVGGNTNILDFRFFIRPNQGAPGFSGTVLEDGPSSPVSGVGDNALFAAKDGIGANLIANKGLTSIFIATQGPVSGASFKAAMVAVVLQALTQLGA